MRRGSGAGWRRRMRSCECSTRGWARSCAAARRGGAACALPAGLASMGSGAEGGLVGGVSSLGYSGTIAHALLQCALVAVAATGA